MHILDAWVLALSVIQPNLHVIQRVLVMRDDCCDTSSGNADSKLREIVQIVGVGDESATNADLRCCDFSYHHFHIQLNA